MVPGSGHVIFLTGAPSVETLQWNENELVQDFTTPIQRFLGIEEVENHQSSQTMQPRPSISPALWRRPVINGDERFPNNSRLPQPQTKLYQAAASDNTNSRYEDDEYTSFLEESFINLTDLTTTQISPASAQDIENANPQSTTLQPYIPTLATSSHNPSTTSPDSSSPEPNLLTSLIHLPNLQITNLNRIPTASRLQSLHPQTPTVNLIAGIISIAAPKTVQVRKRSGKEMQIVDMVVGDETRAGFTISFWLDPHSGSREDGGKRGGVQGQLDGRRNGDVVLLRNVALAAFRGVVHGQSLLMGKLVRSRTEVLRIAEGLGEMGEDGWMQEKARRVMRWRDDFVGRGRGGEVLRRGKRGRSLEELPADTQD